jgi:hypothetical protein
MKKILDKLITVFYQTDASIDDAGVTDVGVSKTIQNVDFSKGVEIARSDQVFNIKQIEDDSDGQTQERFEIQVPSITSIDIQNIIELESHQITRIFNSTSHHIRFLNGGEVQLSYNNDGVLLELTTKKAAVRASFDGKLTLLPYDFNPHSEA